MSDIDLLKKFVKKGDKKSYLSCINRNGEYLEATNGYQLLRIKSLEEVPEKFKVKDIYPKLINIITSYTDMTMKLSSREIKYLIDGVKESKSAIAKKITGYPFIVFYRGAIYASGRSTENQIGSNDLSVILHQSNITTYRYPKLFDGLVFNSRILLSSIEPVLEYEYVFVHRNKKNDTALLFSTHKDILKSDLVTLCMPTKYTLPLQYINI